MSPSRRHELLAWAVPRLRKSRDLDTVEAERERIERWHTGLERTLPTRAVPRFTKRFSVVTEQVVGPSGTFSSYVVTPRGIDPKRTVFYLHGGGFVAPIDPFHLRYVSRLARSVARPAGGFFLWLDVSQHGGSEAAARAARRSIGGSRRPTPSVRKRLTRTRSTTPTSAPSSGPPCGSRTVALGQ